MVLQPTKASGLWLFFAEGSHAYIVKKNYFKITPANQRFKSITGHKKYVTHTWLFIFPPARHQAIAQCKQVICRLLLQQVIAAACTNFTKPLHLTKCSQGASDVMVLATL